MPTRIFFFFFFNDTATTEIYTLSLHDALPICRRRGHLGNFQIVKRRAEQKLDVVVRGFRTVHNQLIRDHRRSEEHTSELQSQSNLVCRLLLEKKKKKNLLTTLHIYCCVRCNL